MAGKMAVNLLLLVTTMTVTVSLARKDDTTPRVVDDGRKCSVTFEVDAKKLRQLCKSTGGPQSIVDQGLESVKADSAKLKADLEEMKSEYNSMVDEVKALKADTATWREVVEWPQLEPEFKPDNETLYMLTDGPTYKDCRDAVGRNNNQHGIYSILPGDALLPFMAYCDEEGWTVIQRRFDGSENFYREWTEYQEGFGHLSGEYWLGLESIYLLTNQDNYDLRVEVLGYNGKLYFSQSPGFKLESETTDYVLHVGNMTAGNYKDLMVELDGSAFTTHDNDNDGWWERNCARYYHGAFWLQNCGFDLNREYCAGRGCMTWGDRIAKKSLMKIRPSSGEQLRAARMPRRFKTLRTPTRGG